jgi:hypothetical protein
LRTQIGVFLCFIINILMPRFLAPITVGQETVTGTETISGNQIILSGTYGKDSYWTSVSASGGLSADHANFVNNVSASYFYGDGSHLLNARDTTKLPLSGGTLNGKLFGNDADFSNSLFSTTISAVDFIGNGSLLTNIAKLYSPAFVGIPTAPTAPANTNTTQIATTQFVIENGGDRYLTTSNSTLTVNNNNNISLTAGAGLSYISGQDITIVHSPTQYINATVVSYNKTTGVMVYNGNSNVGSGTFNTWTINVGGVPAVGSLIASNNLSDVASTSASLANLGGFPNTGGTLNGGLTGTNAQFNSVTFTPNAVNLPYQVGKVWYDTNKDALCYYNSVSGNKLHIGQEIQQYVRNATANTILKGDVVRIFGFNDQSPDVVLAQATSLSGSIITGVANQDIPPNTNGYIVTIGEVANYDTSRFFAGEDLFLSPLSAGKITNVLPTNPYFAVQVGVCMYSHETNGKLLVYTQYLGTAANTVVGIMGIEQLPTDVGSTVSTVSSLSSRWESVYTTVNSNSSTYVTLTGTQTLKNKTVVDWMTLVRGYNTTPTLLATIGTGDVYTYIYNSSPSNITYYRYIATDGTVDAFYTYFAGNTLSGLVASKSITL